MLTTVSNSVLFSWHVSPGGQTQALGLGGRCLSLLGHLVTQCAVFYSWLFLRTSSAPGFTCVAMPIFLFCGWWCYAWGEVLLACLWGHVGSLSAWLLVKLYTFVYRFLCEFFFSPFGYCNWGVELLCQTETITIQQAARLFSRELHHLIPSISITCCQTWSTPPQKIIEWKVAEILFCIACIRLYCWTIVTNYCYLVIVPNLL